MEQAFSFWPSDGILGSMFRRRQDPIATALESFELPREVAERLSRQGTLVHLPAGTTLCTEGERGLQAFVILDGRAQVLAPDAVITVGPGSVVGELATLDRKRTRNATVVATEDVDVLVYDVRTFADLADDPSLRTHLTPRGLAAA